METPVAGRFIACTAGQPAHVERPAIPVQWLPAYQLSGLDRSCAGTHKRRAAFGRRHGPPNRVLFNRHLMKS